MATEQLFTVWGNGFGGINLSHSVGTGRRNDLGDVMLVQALLNFIVKATGEISKVGLRRERDLPDVSGHWDAWFDVAVMAFQRKHANLLVGEPLGQMFPVSNPFSVEGEERFPTIVLLNHMCDAATGILRNQIIEATKERESGFPYPTSLLLMFPQLRKQLV